MPEVKASKVRASDAGKALNAITNKLWNAGVLEHEGFNVLQRVVRDLRSRKRKLQWSQEVSLGEPVVFKHFKASNGSLVRPQIESAYIKVNQEDNTRPPFKSLDIAIIVEQPDGPPLSRWHIDLANRNDGKFQSGPLFHLQYGGRMHNHVRSVDLPVKVPRWCHPPMELALVCEVIAANYFEGAWLEFRDDPTWCESIRLFQRLCYGNFLDKLQASLNGPANSTILGDVWASNWGEA